MADCGSSESFVSSSRSGESLGRRDSGKSIGQAAARPGCDAPAAGHPDREVRCQTAAPKSFEMRVNKRMQRGFSSALVTVSKRPGSCFVRFVRMLLDVSIVRHRRFRSTGVDETSYWPCSPTLAGAGQQVAARDCPRRSCLSCRRSTRRGRNEFWQIARCVPLPIFSLS